MSANQERIWAEREESGEKKIISDKSGKTSSENNALLTDEERIERFGWLNRLSEDEKEIWKTKIMFKTGMHLWRQTATTEEKLLVQRKRNATKLKVSEEIISNLEENLKDREKYYNSVKYLTSITYYRYKNILDKDSLRGNGYHLDHRFSIIQGFINKIPPEIISSVYNLEIITKKDNLSKNSDCSITKEYLLEKYNGK